MQNQVHTQLPRLSAVQVLSVCSGFVHLGRKATNLMTRVRNLVTETSFLEELPTPAHRVHLLWCFARWGGDWIRLIAWNMLRQCNITVFG